MAAELRVASLVLALALAGCGGGLETRSAEGDSRVLGKPLESAIELFGPTYREVPAPDGRRRYEWVVVEELLVSGGAGPPQLGVSRQGTGTYTGGKRRPPKLVTQTCTLTVEVSTRTGLAEGWQAAGEACPEVLRARLR